MSYSKSHLSINDKPYSVLYTTGDQDPGQIFKSRPFLSYNEALDYIYQHNGEEFNLDVGYVYILAPDHRMIPVISDDLTMN